MSLWVKRERRQEIPFPNPISKLTQKSPMWRWYEVVKWLHQNKLMKDQKVVDLAMFIENINAVLGERDPDIQQYRHQILKKLKLSNSEGHISN